MNDLQDHDNTGAEFQVGQMVETLVSMPDGMQPMARGRITAVHSGYCDVDVMSHHGGAPWIQMHPNSHLRADRTMECTKCGVRKHLNDFATPDECEKCHV